MFANFLLLLFLCVLPSKRLRTYTEPVRKSAMLILRWFTLVTHISTNVQPSHYASLKAVWHSKANIMQKLFKVDFRFNFWTKKDFFGVEGHIIPRYPTFIIIIIRRRQQSKSSDAAAPSHDRWNLLDSLVMWFHFLEYLAHNNGHYGEIANHRCHQYGHQLLPPSTSQGVQRNQPSAPFFLTISEKWRTTCGAWKSGHIKTILRRKNTQTSDGRFPPG